MRSKSIRKRDLGKYSPKFHLSRHVTTRQARHVVRIVTWRDVLCRAYCALLVPTWRTMRWKRSIGLDSEPWSAVRWRNKWNLGLCDSWCSVACYAQIPPGSSRLDMTRHVRRVDRARRDKRVEPCCSTSSIQPKCMGSTRRTCRVVSRRDVTYRTKWN